jgi:SAM-dependent methyltransferase
MEKGKEDVELLSCLVDNLLSDYKNEDNKRHQISESIYKSDNPLVARWYFIPAYSKSVVRNLVKVNHLLNRSGKEHPTFIDAGCGIGWVTYLANLLSFESYGLEIEEANVSVGKKKFFSYSYPEKLLVGDILQHDYSGYDCIYYYCPIRDTNLQKKFEARVENQMKTGAYLISFHKQDKTIERDKRFTRPNKKLYPELWKKIKK